MFLSNAPVARIASALVLAFKWMLVLVASFVLVVVVPIIELVGELYGLVRRAVRRLR